MKFIYATDAQLKASNPGCRLDNFPTAMKAKFFELGEVARAENAEAIFIGGDLFDGPKTSNKFLGEIGEIFKKYHCPVYVVPGNHDLFGYSLSTVDQTSLGVLAKHGVIKLLTRASGPEFFMDKNGCEVSFEGQEFHKDIDQGKPEDDYYVTSKAQVRVLIPHGMLIPKPFFGAFTLIGDLPLHGGPDLILGAHYHPGFATIQHGDTMVANPKAMARDEASDGNYHLDAPRYLVLDVDPSQHKFSLDIREFVTAKPGTEVINRQALLDKKAKDASLTNFKTSIDTTTTVACDIQGILRNIATQAGIDSLIQLKALDAMAQAESAEVSVSSVSGYVEKTGTLSITRVILNNFQSHAHTEVDLGSGLNAFTGSSDCGKTAIFRAIRWVLYNDPKGSDFIRTGTKKCSVTLEFSDGTKITRERTSSGAGSYSIYDPVQGAVTDYKGFANNVPVEVFNAHQMPKTRLTKDLEISLNLATQLEGPFLLSETAGVRATAIGRLTGVHIVDAAIRDIGREIINGNSYVKSQEKQLESVEEKLKGFEDLTELESRINMSNLILTGLDMLEKRVQDFELLQKDISTVRTKTLELATIYSHYAHVKKTPVLIREAETTLIHLETMQDLKSKLSKNTEEHISIESEMKMIPKYDAAKIQEGIEVLKHLNELELIQRNLGTVQFGIFTLANDLKLAKSEDAMLSSRIPEIKQLIDRLKDLESLNDAVHVNKQMIKSEESKLDQQTELYDQSLTDYKAMLLEAGECPTCHSIITDRVLAGISGRRS